MDIAAAVVGVVGLVTFAAWLLMRLLKTFVELRKISTGLSVLRWALGQTPADPSDPGSAINGRSTLGSG